MYTSGINWGTLDVSILRSVGVVTVAIEVFTANRPRDGRPTLRMGLQREV